MYIMPFVYSAGFVVLTIESAIFGKKVQTVASPQSHGVFFSLAVSTVPWVLGIVIAHPLTIAGADFDDCEFPFSLEREKATVWICQILPVIAAALVTSLNVCCNRNNTTPLAPVESEQISNTCTIPNKPIPVYAHGEPNQPSAFPQQQQQLPPTQQYLHSGPPFVGQPQNELQVHQNMSNFYGQPAYTDPFHGLPSQHQPGQYPNQVVYPLQVSDTLNHQPPRPLPTPGLDIYYSTK